MNTTSTDLPLLVSARAAAKMLGISERCLWTKTADGTIPCLKIGTRKLYSADHLRQWVAAQLQANAAAPAGGGQ